MSEIYNLKWTYFWPLEKRNGSLLFTTELCQMQWVNGIYFIINNRSRIYQTQTKQKLTMSMRTTKYWGQILWRLQNCFFSPFFSNFTCHMFVTHALKRVSVTFVSLFSHNEWVMSNSQFKLTYCRILFSISTIFQGTWPACHTHYMHQYSITIFLLYYNNNRNFRTFDWLFKIIEFSWFHI